MNKKLFIFDLDGTLVDAYPAIISSFNFTLVKLGYRPQKTAVIRKAVGWGDANLIKPFVRHKDFKKALSIYRLHHAKSIKTGVRWMPQAQALLSCLKKRGALLAIASNRPTKFTHLILKRLGGRAIFHKILCGDRIRFGKPHPLILNRIVRELRIPRKDAVYIGDMVIDVQTGRRAGICTAAVATGSSSAFELKLAKPDYLFRDLKALRHACQHPPAID